jgi:TonB family protein
MIAGAVLLIGATPALAQEADKPCTAPNQPMRPIMATHAQPPYPELSVMTNEEGTTLIEVAIGADGVPTDAIVVVSSGSLRLDAAAADYVKSTWRWNAPVVNCKPVAVRTRVSVKWDLRDSGNTGPEPPSVNMDVNDYPPGARQRHEQGTVVMTMVILPDGQATPRVEVSSGFPELDAKSMEVAKRWHFTPATLDGRPIVTAIYLVSVWKLDTNK